MLATVEKVAWAAMTTVLVARAIVQAPAQVNGALVVTVKMHCIGETLTRGQTCLPFRV